MSKDFQGWGDYQQELESRDKPRRPFQEGQVWRCAIGHNIGTEIDGKSRRYWRPVIVIRKFYDEFLIGVPLTSSSNKRPFHIPVTVKGKNGYAVVNQLRSLDARRLQQYLATLTAREFEAVRSAVTDIFEKI